MNSNSSPTLIALAALPMLVIMTLVTVLIWISFQTGILGTSDATYTLSNYVDVFDDSIFLEAVSNTIIFSITATLVAMVIGLPIAWVTERTTLRGKSWIYVIMTLGLLIPGIYTAMGWTFLAHERIGFLNRWAVQIFGFSEAPLNIATPIGMGFVQGLSLAALGFILTAQMFRSMNPSLEEAAGIHGLGFFSTLRRITLPLAMPAILAAVIYIVVIGIATFDVPAIIGMGSRVYLLSTYIFQKTNPGDEELAQHGITAALGVMMILVAVLLTWWYSSVLRKGDQYGVVTGKGYRPTLIEIGNWGYAAWGFIAFYVLAAKLVPLLLIAYAAFVPYLAPPSAKMFGLMSLTNIMEAMDWDLVLRGMKNTAILVLTVPALTLVLAFAISWLIVRSRSRVRYLLEFGAFLPHALPEVILAIAALLLALFVLQGIAPLYGSVTLIAIVYVITRISFATRAINSALLQIHKELEEAAHTAGLSAVRTSWRILVPLLRPTLMSVWIWSAILVYRELTVAVFLVGQDNLTLPAVIWSYWQSGATNLAAGVTLVMTILLTPLILIFWWFGRKSVMSS
ncbi:MAG: iron ABC transporter permease [Rhodospirillaceae bacterium]|nr:iron ABC transporter permease [Rhodospirillaceae bacterium]MBT5459541.1 iron ABC transporter permease [Rhodospirillaceae bacterium]